MSKLNKQYERLTLLTIYGKTIEIGDMTFLEAIMYLDTANYCDVDYFSWGNHRMHRPFH